MTNNKTTKRGRGVTLREPKDARRIIKRLVDQAFRDERELELMGRIVNALNCWAKFWEMEKVAELETRIKRLEEENK